MIVLSLRLAKDLDTANTTSLRLTFSKRPAFDERVSCHILGTEAHRRDSADLALRPDSTHPIARILTGVVVTHRSAGRAVLVLPAFRPACDVRVPVEALGTLAHSLFAFCVRATPGARVHAGVADAVLRRTAVCVRLALVEAASEG